MVDPKFEDRAVSLFSGIGVKGVSGWGDLLVMTKMVKVLCERTPPMGFVYSSIGRCSEISASNCVCLFDEVSAVCF